MEEIKSRLQVEVINQAFIEQRPPSPSSIKAFRKSPKHYIEYLFGEKVEKDAYTMGNLVDILITEPESFDNRVLVYDKPNLRTNDGKAEMEKLRETATEKHLAMATRDDVEQARLAVEGVMSVDLARELIEARTAGQVDMSWRNRKHNLPIRGKIDFVSKAWGEEWIVEVKTTRSADPDDFRRQAYNLGYDIQAGGYLDGYHKTRYRFPYFIFLAIEVEPPYNCSVNFCDNKYIEEAKKEWLGSLAAFRYCMDNGLFHQGYEFRLHTMPYFSMEYPGYHKPLFRNFDTDESHR